MERGSLAREKGGPFLSLVYCLGVFLIFFPEPSTTFLGSLLVGWALHQTLKRFKGAYGPCRCDYQHYGPCQWQGFPYLQVWSCIPSPLRVSVGTGERGNMPRTGLFQLPGTRASEGWNRTITYRVNPISRRRKRWRRICSLPWM